MRKQILQLGKALVMLTLLLALAGTASAQTNQYAYGTGNVAFDGGDWGFVGNGYDGATRQPALSAGTMNIHNALGSGTGSGWSAYAWNAPANEVITSITFTEVRNWGYWIPALFAESASITSHTYDSDYTPMYGTNQASLDQLIAVTQWHGAAAAWGGWTNANPTITFDVSEVITSVGLGLVTKSVLAAGTGGLASGQEALTFSAVAITTAPVPEPATMVILMSGSCVMYLRRRRK